MEEVYIKAPPPLRQVTHEGYGNRGILSRMAEVKDMYKVTRFVSHRTAEDLINHEIKSHDDATINLVEEFMDSSRNLIMRRNFERVARAINNSLSNDYLRFSGNKNEGYFIDIDNKGYHLLGKSYYFFRVGLWDESLKHYDKAQTVAVVMVTALIGAIGGGVIGYILHALLG